MRNWPPRWSILAAAGVGLLLPCGQPRSARSAPDDKAPAKVFVGYLFAQPREIHFRLYTHICHAFLVADGEGRIERKAHVPSAELAAEAHKAGVKMILSLGGWGWDKQFAAIVSRPESMDRYVRGVMELVDQSDYDGIDLDWEYPDTRDEVAGFERLTRRFRKDLDELGRKKGRPMIVTMAASANPGTLKWLDRSFLLETMDWINVMTYDYAGDWSDHAGHNSPLFASTKRPGQPASTERTMRYLLEERHLPADRLAVGIPLYGRGFNVAEPYASTKDVAEAPPPPRRLRQLAQARVRPELDAPLGRPDEDPMADLEVRPSGDRLRRRRVGGDQDGMGDEAGLPGRLLLADPRRPPARRHQPAAGGVAPGVGEGRRKVAVGRTSVQETNVAGASRDGAA